MIGLDKLQVLTFLFGVIIVLVTVLNYQSTSMNSSWHRLIDLLDNGLAFFFIAYAIAVNSETTSSSRSRGFGTRGMYTAFLVVLSITSWLLWILNGSLVSPATGSDFVDSVPLQGANDDGWKKVSTQVARPIALGSLFVLPYIYSSF